ncbi:putative angiotensin-converting enzyme 2 [Tanacetum coccineum]
MEVPKVLDVMEVQMVLVFLVVLVDVEHLSESLSYAEAPVPDTGSASISSNDNRKVSREDIELVQNLIERCLQLYMNKDEVVKTLLNRARIDPGFTALVWQKLEEENADFFRAYYIRLKLKKQIILFNHLLEHQYHLTKHPVHPRLPLAPIQNDIHPMPGTHPIKPTKPVGDDHHLQQPLAQPSSADNTSPPRPTPITITISIQQQRSPNRGRRRATDKYRFNSREIQTDVDKEQTDSSRQMRQVHSTESHKYGDEREADRQVADSDSR